MHLLRFVSILLLSILAPLLSVEAKNVALLVGISKYRLPTISKLEAPKNDVALLWDLLRERGFRAEDITVLADQIDPDHKSPIPHDVPTADNILKKLDAIAAGANRGDLIVVYFSGHGSYIRQRTPKIGETTEQSGFNQIFLAIDAQKADQNKAEIPGGILDKVLKQKFDAIKEKAFLWVILDSCHSGGLTRDVNIDATIHFVPPTVLNLDEGPGPSGAEANRWIAGGIGSRQVAFLAAPEDSPAFEKPVSELHDKPYSLFTQSLVRLLEAENFGSYRELGEALILKQASLAGHVPTPVIEGDLDQPTFDGSALGPRAWEAKYDENTRRVRVGAGSLQGIAIGTILGFENSGDLVGYGEVESSDILSSVAHPQEFYGKPSPPVDKLRTKLTAKVIRSTIDLTLAVAVPPVKDEDGSEASRLGLQAIRLLKDEQNSPLPIHWLLAGQNADVHLRVINGVIYLVPATGELVRSGRRRTAGVAISDIPKKIAEDLREDLWRLLRQLNLRRAAEQMQRTDFANSIDVRLRLIRNQNEFASAAKDEKQPCETWARNPDTMPSVHLGAGSPEGIKLTHCDRVSIEIVNRWPKDVDVTLLYLDSEGGIGALGEGDEARVKAGQAHFPQKFQPVRIVTWCDAKVWSLCRNFKTSGYQPIGTERLIVIITEATATKHTYYYLAQNRLSKAVERRTRGERAGVPLEDLLTDAGLYPGRTRGTVDKAAPGTIKLFSLEVVPPGELAGQ